MLERWESHCPGWDFEILFAQRASCEGMPTNSMVAMVMSTCTEGEHKNLLPQEIPISAEQPDLRKVRINTQPVAALQVGSAASAGMKQQPPASAHAAGTPLGTHADGSAAMPLARTEEGAHQAGDSACSAQPAASAAAGNSAARVAELPAAKDRSPPAPQAGGGAATCAAA